ncbi:proline-specific permease [Zopfia rhizophila CBS 207.26]|uniref:Proline-specific permease n=1 Tax=Zopfia rhizophila CBS 207.26 TaxID=1314779 RepID=A0A6A6E9R9_9PEZI|nr:proline-specific permease [Zopfia rhizophila CBS 207.26]
MAEGAERMENLMVLEHEDSDMQEEKGTSLRADLKERHVNMIAFSACVGIGLFLQSGRVVYQAGPGLAVVAYILMGTVMASTISCLGEMTALFPVQGPIFEFPRRFLDVGVGYAAGWLAWFSWTVIIAAEVLAVIQLWDFQFSEEYLREVGYPENTLSWPVGQDASPAVWCGLFLTVILIVGFIPVRQYGQLEYIIGTTKMIFISLLILFNVIINAQKRVKHNGNSRFWTYNNPYSFAAQNFTLKIGPDGQSQTIEGALGRFTGMWSAMTTVIWSLIGFETVAISAAENMDLRRNETVKLATRKSALRVILMYCLSVFVVGLNVPYTDTNIQDLTMNSIRSGQNSIFILAAVRNHVRWWPHFFNGFFIFSATTSAINSLYNSSRILHALSKVDSVWPRWYAAKVVQKKLKRTKRGVPWVSVIVSWFFGLLAFLSTKSFSTKILGRIATNSVVSMMVVYVIIDASYLSFYYKIKEEAEQHRGIGESPYDRGGTRYPYRSHLQWLKACYGMVGCFLVTVFGGWRAFASPFNVADFIASYISIVAFFVLVAAYHISWEGWNPLNWKRSATFQLRNPPPIQVELGMKRRGDLRLTNDNSVFSRQNFDDYIQWLWTWMK